MTWTYRVMRKIDRGEATYAVHEVYDLGEPGVCWTMNGVAPCGHTLEELRTDLLRMVAAVLDKPVLDYETGAEIKEIGE